MPKIPPALLFVLLILLGGGAALFLPSREEKKTVAGSEAVSQPRERPAAAQAEPEKTGEPKPAGPVPEPAAAVAGSSLRSLLAPEPPLPEGAAPLPPGSQENLLEQVQLLEGQVEYLQGQVMALQEENAQLLQKLGTLGMKNVPQMNAAPMQDDEPPDFVGLGIEMMKFRELQALPTPTAGATMAEVEASILTWLRKQYPDDQGPRMGLALTALGWIDKPVDPLPVRAALWARQIGGWYDENSGTLLIAEKSPIPGMPAPDRPLAIAFGQLLREYGDTLFPPERKDFLTTDERLARECLIAGDAGLTRFLFSLRNPSAAPTSDLPAEDPDHPLNEVQAPVFVRELAMFPFRPGFEFAQSLHSAGNFAQLNAAYARPPKSCGEIIEVEKYLETDHLPATRPEFAALKVGDNEPYWDDSLGRFAIFNALRTYNSDEESGQAARGWQGDRLLTYAAPEHPRDHAAWQTLWLTPEQADLFFKAMGNCLRQRYDAEPAEATPERLVLKAGGRSILLVKNRQGQGVLLVDAATDDFAQNLRSTLEGATKAAQ